MLQPHAAHHKILSELKAAAIQTAAIEAGGATPAFFTLGIDEVPAQETVGARLTLAGGRIARMIDEPATEAGTLRTRVATAGSRLGQATSESERRDTPARTRYSHKGARDDRCRVPHVDRRHPGAAHPRAGSVPLWQVRDFDGTGTFPNNMTWNEVQDRVDDGSLVFDWDGVRSFAGGLDQMSEGVIVATVDGAVAATIEATDSTTYRIGIDEAHTELIAPERLDALRASAGSIGCLRIVSPSGRPR